MKRNFICTLTNLILIGLLGMVSISLAEEGTWTKKAGNQIPRFYHSSSVVDGKIYLIGGVKGPGAPDFPRVAEVEVYDPATDTWKKMADMAIPRNGHSSSVVNGIIYIIGGYPTWQKVEAYNPATDTWERKADMPTGRAFFSTSVVEGKIYAIGGSKGAFNGWKGFTTVEAYDPATDTWERKADTPTGRTLHSDSAVNGNIYVIGGADTANLFFSKVEEYDPATDTWKKSSKADMPTSRFAFSCSVVDGKIYAIGGAWGGFSTVEVYDPATNIWTEEVDMPTGRSILSTSVVDGKIYAIGGGPVLETNFPKGVVEALDTGFTPQSVNPAGKLSTTWGEIKAGR